MIRWFSRSVLVLGFAWAASAAQANPVISFGVAGGQPNEELLGGVTVGMKDAVDVANSDIVFGELPLGDLDAFHVQEDGTVLFSVTTAVTVGGISFKNGDIGAWDGVDYSVLLPVGLFGGGDPGIDAVSQLPNGKLLISTNLSATIFGFSFQDGDVVQVDLVNETAGLFEGLDEATLSTGSNKDIDALHYDRSNGHLIISFRAVANGTIGGYNLNGTGAQADLIDLDLTGSGIVASLYFDGAALWDSNNTRDLDAAWLFPQCEDGVDNDADDDVDFPADVGCRFPNSPKEAPQCNDGINNDPAQDLRVDFDGGVAATGDFVTPLGDSNCFAPWVDRERMKCGLGFELGAGVVLAWAIRRRRMQRRS